MQSEKYRWMLWSVRAGSDDWTSTVYFRAPSESDGVREAAAFFVDHLMTWHPPKRRRCKEKSWNPALKRRQLWKVGDCTALPLTCSLHPADHLSLPHAGALGKFQLKSEKCVPNQLHAPLLDARSPREASPNAAAFSSTWRNTSNVHSKTATAAIGSVGFLPAKDAASQRGRERGRGAQMADARLLPCKKRWRTPSTERCVNSQRTDETSARKTARVARCHTFQQTGRPYHL